MYCLVIVLLHVCSRFAALILVLQSFKSEASINDSIYTPIRNLANINLQKLKDDLHSNDWSRVFSCDNPDLAFNQFTDNVNYVYDKNTPPTHKHKFKSKSKPNAPWVTDLILKSINKKNKLYRQYLAHPTNPNRIKCTRYKNILTNLLSTSKKQYYTRQFEQEKNNIRNTWKVINSVLNNCLILSIASCMMGI